MSGYCVVLRVSLTLHGSWSLARSTERDNYRAIPDESIWREKLGTRPICFSH